MGQRFQAFVIAKVVPHGGTKAYYRCVAAWHHQWCYGDLPLRATVRFFRLLRVPVNAAIVQHELSSIQGKYGRQDEKPSMDDVPCPYLAFLVAQAFNFNLEGKQNAYISGTSFSDHVLPADMGSMDGDNNDGIAVLDATDPFHPRYSFAKFQRRGQVAHPRDVVAWSPKEDVRRSEASSDAQEAEEDASRDRGGWNLDAVRALRSELIVTPEMYAEAWPREYRLPASTGEAAPADESEFKNTSMPRLAELATAPAVDVAIASGDTSEIEQLASLPERVEHIKAALRKYTPLPEAGLPILLQILKTESVHDNSLDLSGYATDAAQILSVLGDFATVDSIDLSNHSVVTISTLRDILTAHPAIRRIVLLDTAISSDDLATLIHDEPKLFHHAEEIVHPYLFAWNQEKETKYFPAFNFYTFPPRMYGGGLVITSILLLYPPQIIQAMTDVLTTYANHEDEDDPLAGVVSGTAHEKFLPQVALAAATRASQEKWGDRRVVHFPRVSMAQNRTLAPGWSFMLKHEQKPKGIMQMLFSMQLNGEGGAGVEESMCGFVRIGEDGEQEPVEVDSFLEVMQTEGRPLPTEEAVKEFKRVVEVLNAKGWMTLDAESDNQV